MRRDASGSRGSQVVGTDWREDGTIAETFPPLRRLSGLGLGSSQLEILAISRGAGSTLRCIREHSAARSVGELLDLTWSEVLCWPLIGPERRDEIVQFLAILSADAHDIQADSEVCFETAEPPHAAAGWANQPPEWQAAVEVIGAWAATVAGRSTWADILAPSSLPKPSEVDAAWSLLSAVAVPLGTQRPAKEVLAGFLEELDDRRRLVLLDRVVGANRRTLGDLGSDLGVTRERVRQIESAIKTEVVQAFENGDDWRSVRWAVDALRGRLGASAPLEARSSALPGMPEPLQQIVSWLAGYRHEGGRLLAEHFRPPKIQDLPRLSREGRVIDEFETIEALLAAGVKQEFIEEIVDSIEGVIRIDGQLVDWTGGQESHAITILEVRDQPEDIEELFELAGGGSLTSFRNRVFDSDRIIRVTKTKVGLRSWGGTHYTSITDLMIQRLSGGPMDIQELASELERTYEVSAASVMMYSYAPVFKITGDMVALRGPSDPYVPREKPQAVQGLFRVAAGTLVWHVVLDTDVLRGSGRSLPPEIGTFLGLVPGGEGVVLRNPYDDVPVTWPENSITGPNIGSLRLHAESLGAQKGDRLRLTFTEGADRIGVTLVPPLALGESPADTLSRLSGLAVADCRNLTALAAAIGVNEDQVVETLVKRKDAPVAAAAETVYLSSLRY